MHGSNPTVQCEHCGHYIIRDTVCPYCWLEAQYEDVRAEVYIPIGDIFPDD